MVFGSLFKKRKVLIVDDDRGMLSSLRIIFSKSGYKVFTSLNGEEGLRLAEEVKPDIMLLDIMLPDINGYEVCKILKDEKKTSKIKIILITGKSGMKDVDKGFEKNADGYIIKPFDNEVLLDKCSEILKK